MSEERKYFIPAVTVNNVIEMGYKEMLEGLEPFVLEEIPEGAAGSPEALLAADRLIGRFANLYSYLIYLFSHVSNEANRMKLMGDNEVYSILTRKKDSLYELARAVRYKHEACSRMLTAHNMAESEEVFDRVDHQARAKRAAPKKGKRMKAWEAVR